MKTGIHPKYHSVTATCACGNVIETRSTKPSITVEICSNCHPFFTGKQKIVDSAGRVERFTAKYRNVKPIEKKPAPAPVAARQPIPKVKPVVPLAVPKPAEGGPRGPRSAGPGRSGAGPRAAGGPGRPKSGETRAGAPKGDGTRPGPARGAPKGGPAKGQGAKAEGAKAEGAKADATPKT